VNCFPEEVGTQVVSVFEFWELDRLLFMARDLRTATFSLCHQKLPCLGIKNFPAFSSKLSRFVRENFLALSSKPLPLYHQKLPRVSSKTLPPYYRNFPASVVKNFPASSSKTFPRHPERSEAPAERSRRTPRLYAAPAAHPGISTTTPTSLRTCKSAGVVGKFVVLGTILISGLLLRLSSRIAVTQAAESARPV
jgi:hypothetical protein